jgi:hypothetical protein
MQGYEVVTSDDRKIGHVVDERQGCVIVEHGHVFKSKHAIPRDFIAVDDEARIVHATVTKDVFHDAPKVTDDWSCDATMRHYGLVGSLAEPDTEGYGETVPTDPASAADDSAVEQRASMREGNDPNASGPAVHDRSRTALDPTGVTSNE